MSRMMRVHQTIRPPRAAPMRPLATTGTRRAAPPAPALFRLQQGIGNQALGRLVRAKLKVAAPDDPFEREADRVADLVMRAPPAAHAVTPTRPGPVLAAKTRVAEMPEVTPDLERRIGTLGGGRPLSEAARAFFEPRFGRDFGGVRVHTDGAAAASAGRLRARAFTAGRDIVFGAGGYAPGTTAGWSLLAHELAHVVQQAPARAASEAAPAARGRLPLSARPVAVQRQPAPANTGMTRDELARRLRAVFGHDVTIEVGDRERQTRELGGPRARRRLPDDWRAWDPGASAPLYDEILGAIEDFSREVGGVPDIRQIVFYNVRYGYDEHDNVVADTNAAAEIRRRERVMIVYRGALFETDVVAGGQGIRRSGVFLASARSTPGRRGTSASMGAATRAESQRRAVAHELGHGVEWASGALREFEQAVGWVRVAGELRLYDIQARGVKQAIARGAEPPAAARVTKRDWNSGAHLEQPMREYAVSDSAEDFADSLMAWLYARDALKARSPARFGFFDDQARRRGWLPKLVTSGAPTQTTP